MGTFDQSSSPLSTLMPQYSPYKLPDYSNAFKMNNLMQMNNLKFKIGLLTSDSSDSTTALNGKNMMNDAVNPNYTDSLYLQSTNSGSNSGNTNVNWDLGFNALNQVGNRIGGLAGNIINRASTLGSSIRMINLANKRIKDGLAGASDMKRGAIGATVGAASDLVGSFMPLKTEYEGDKGDITQTMDSVYDGISDAAMSFGPGGALIGGIMKGGALLSKGINALGGGTSGMTTTDAILGSSFLGWTPLGLVNGFGGKKADTITRDNEAFAQVGSSYTGSEYTVNDALTKSGKKYGLFSSGARRKANETIAEAKRLLNTISDISLNTLNRLAIRTAMSAINGNRYGLALLGGYNQPYVRIGRRGMSIDLLQKVKSIIKALNGTKLEEPSKSSDSVKDYVYNRFPVLKNISFELLNDNNFLPRRDLGDSFGDIEYMTSKHDDLPYYNNYQKPDEYKGKSVIVYNNNVSDEDIALDALSHGLRELDSYWNKKIIPSLKREWDNYIFDEGIGRYSHKSPQEWKSLSREEKDAIIENFYKSEDYDNIVDGLVRQLLVKPELRKLLRYSDDLDYINQLSNTNAWKQALDYINTGKIPQHKNGGSIITLVKESVIELVNPNDVLEFKNGGSINVIPDGALHARKHNMDLEGITEKGIPVVSEKDNGKVELQAEIEKEEVIFRLEVTLKLEKLEKKYYSEETSLKEKDELALEAGKLITKELLHNTKDNAGLL